MQRVRAVIDGQTVRINVSTKAIRQGLIVKPQKRNYQAPAETATAE
jgi:ribosomal protein L28